MLRVANLTKLYGTASGGFGVRDVSFSVRAGEFFTLLGPSGCGKTTTLRSIAGLEEPSEGEIEINGELVYSRGHGVLVPTERRQISMVFQSYAVWPHLTVGQNVGFPLEVQKMPAAEIRARVEATLAMVGLAGLADRPAPFLSGGQQQRVALARAIVKGAPVLLLDEPLSNLDAKLREDMRAELRDLQRRIGTTAVYVTHDQEEALAMSDRVAVMNAGGIVELGTPQALYFAPQTAFTARFIGQADLWPCRLLPKRGDAVVVEAPWGHVHSRCVPAALGDSVALMVRPEHVEIVHADPPSLTNVFTAVVAKTVFAGKLVEYVVRLGESSIRVQCTSLRIWEPGNEIRIRLPPERCVIVNGDAVAGA